MKSLYLYPFILFFISVAAFANEPKVAIWEDSVPPQTSHADPQELSGYLESKSIPCERIDTETLSDPARLSPAMYDIVILPYGSCFPLSARESFIRYLKQGGAFISLGGYAFDSFVEKKGETWQIVEMDDPKLFLSGRRGKKGDWIDFYPDQLVLFDPTYNFKRVETIGKSEKSPLSGPSWNREMQVQGFPATAMTGNNSPVYPKPYARWYSLIDSYDRYRHPCGSVFALMLHHDGPYRGSAWAFSGVTDENIFSSKYPEILNSFADAIGAIRTRTFLVSTSVEKENPLSSNWVLSATIANFSNNAQNTNVSLGDSSKVHTQSSALAPGITCVIEDLANQPLGFQAMFAEVKVNEQFSDHLENGFIATATGPVRDVTFSQNYLHINGQSRFLFGSNQTGMVWYSPRENPATWERDFLRMKDYGLRMLRVLHFSPFAAQGYEGRGGHSSRDLAGEIPARLTETADQLVQMCKRHGILLMLTLHDWLDTELKQEELDAQRRWDRFWSERYRNEPHVLFDIQNEPSQSLRDVSPFREMWNDYLRERYQTDARLRELWGQYAPQESLGQLPLEPGPDQWDNPRRVEFSRFRAQMLKRWVDANTQGIREGNPAALATVGFLQHSFTADKWLTTGSLDVQNVHYHGPIEGFPPVLKVTDRRFRGQGLSVGEFGSWDAHEARAHGQFRDESPKTILHFLALGHETLGMGGSFALNWDLKEMPDCVFPWGLTYAQDNVPKDWLYAYRNMSLFFSFLQPVYQDPGLYLVLPDSHRLGGDYGRQERALQQSLQWLFAAHVNFSVINEEALSELPSTARTLIWPVPYCPSDDSFERAVQFVQRGGRLYFSGDISYDEWRRPTRRDRYARLGLIFPPLTEADESSRCEMQSSQLGNGSVHYLPHPAEFQPEVCPGNPYIPFLEHTSVSRIPVQPDDPALHIFSLPESNGNMVYTFFRNKKTETAQEYKVQTPAGRLSFSLNGLQTGLLEISPTDQILAVEGLGDCRIDDRPLVSFQGHAMLRALDEQSQPESRLLLILPTEKSLITLPTRSMKNPMVVAGEFVQGRWMERERWAPQPLKPGEWTIAVDEPQSTLLLLLGEEENISVGVNQLTARMIECGVY